MKAKELADMLQISDKTLRAWLRVNFTRPLSEKGKEWDLNDKQIIAAIEWFKRISIPRRNVLLCEVFYFFSKKLNITMRKSEKNL
tara:strand:+ start:3913 stop:4167 length:255 start_codon:yes stop_codon:yes gene_type:complete